VKAPLLELGVHNLQVIFMKALAIILVVPLVSLSAHENNGRGTKAIALANAFVALADNPWAVSYNPAGLPQVCSPEVATFYIPQQFGIPELRTISISGSYAVNPGTVGAFIEQFGFDLYRTTSVGLGYGVSLEGGVSVGAAIDVERTSIARYGVSNDVTLDVGLLGRPLDKLTIGFCLKNITASRIGLNQERLPQYLTIGTCYTPFKDFCLVTEVEKDIQFPLVVKAGIEETFFEFLSVRCGVANNPDKFSAGIAIRYSSIEFGYAGYSHSDLGWTHQIEVAIQWGS
jgi:hypothetical protein